MAAKSRPGGLQGRRPREDGSWSRRHPRARGIQEAAGGVGGEARGKPVTPISQEVAQLHLFAGAVGGGGSNRPRDLRATAYRNWSYAWPWLQDALDENP